MGNRKSSVTNKKTVETAGKGNDEREDKKKHKSTKSILVYLSCGLGAKKRRNDSPNRIEPNRLQQEQRKSDNTQDSQEIEDKSSETLGPKATLQGSSRRDSSYDNVSNSEDTQIALIHEEPLQESEGSTEEDVENQEQHEQFDKKPKGEVIPNLELSGKNAGTVTEDVTNQEKHRDLTTQTVLTHETERKESENVTRQKPPKQINVEPKQDSVIYTEPSQRKEGNTSESASSQNQSEPKEVHAASSTNHNENETPMNKNKGNSKEDTTPAKVYDANRMEARRPVGLQNLGNTCFFNAVLQNLNQSFLLYYLLDEKGCDRKSLTKSMINLYEQMRSRASCANPYDVLCDVCKRSPRFAGGRQQDSHELLRHLLDGLRIEERESSGNPNNRKILTTVDEVFGGHFMTVYTCKDCKMPYHVCEPMLDISLPIVCKDGDFDNNEGSDVDREEKEANSTTGDDLSYEKAAESLMTPLAVEGKKDAHGSQKEHGPETERQKSSKKKKEKDNKRKKSDSHHSPLKKSRRDGRSILDCLGAFTRTEHIADEYLCMFCHAKRVEQGATDYKMTSAKKRTLIYNPPALLTLHLKRFEQTDYGFVKCNDRISFQHMIDIGPYCSSWCMRNERNDTNIWYSLYGLVVHGGSLDGGHYVAYVKMRTPDNNVRQFIQESFLDRDELTGENLVKMMRKMKNQPDTNHENKWKPEPANDPWFYISDSHFSEVSENEVLQQQAYLLFYERRQPQKSEVYSRKAESGGTSV